MRNPKTLFNKAVAILICTLFFSGLIYGVSAQADTIVMAQASTFQPHIGGTLTVLITISNVQNLAGIDTTLQWNPNALSLSSSNLNLGVEIHQNGVLHGSAIKTDVNNLNAGDIYAMETKVSGSYELVATESGKSTQSFSGSGTIATLTFNVLAAGSADLSLASELSDFPVSGQPSNLINHQDSADVVNVGSSSPSSSSTATISPSATASPSSSATPVTPEYSALTMIVVFVAFASVALVFSAKKLGQTTNPLVGSN